jgi:hypothetical protein
MKSVARVKTRKLNVTKFKSTPSEVEIDIILVNVGPDGLEPSTHGLKERT